MLDFMVLTQQCAPLVAPHTMAAIVRVESGFNPYAIGIVGGRLARQPSNLAEALATARALDAHGYVYSVGLAQIRRTNLDRYHLSLEGGFEPCTNLAASAQILASCFVRARNTHPDDQQALRIALSCYYSGNERTGFTQGYVQKVVTAAGTPLGPMPIPLVPALEQVTDVTPAAEHLDNTVKTPERNPPGRQQPAPAKAKPDPDDAFVF